MEKAKFLALLETEQNDFEQLVSNVRFDLMVKPGVSGMYSIKDIVAHINAYNRALVIWLKSARDGLVYVDQVLDQPDQDERNAVIYEINKNREISEIMQDFRQTWKELVESVSMLTTEELNNAEKTAWFVEPRWKRKQVLWKCIAEDSYLHQQQHIPDIKRWL